MILAQHIATERHKLTPALRESVFQRDSGICQLCLEPVAGRNWHIDHVIPLCQWGLTTYVNLQLTHELCNLKKGRSQWGWSALLSIFTLYELYGGIRPMPEDLKSYVRPQQQPRPQVQREPAATTTPLKLRMTYEQQSLAWGLDAYVGAQIPLGVK